MAEESEIFYLERDQLLKINSIVEYNALIRDINLLDSAINAPRQSAYYEGLDIVAQASILIERIVFNHPFVDGNKRTALIAGAMFFLVNNLEIVPTSEEEELSYAKEIERLVVSKDRERFLQWLRAHIHNHMIRGISVMKETEANIKKASQKPTPATPIQKAIEISMKQFAKELEYLKDR